MYSRISIIVYFFDNYIAIDLRIRFSSDFKNLYFCDVVDPFLKVKVFDTTKISFRLFYHPIITISIGENSTNVHRNRYGRMAALNIRRRDVLCRMIALKMCRKTEKNYRITALKIRGWDEICRMIANKIGDCAQLC
jgi:hypothetical protein